MSEQSIATNIQLYNMIKELKEDLKGDLGEIKDDIKDVKTTLSAATMTIASHEIKLENQDKRIEILEKSGHKTHVNIQNWLMILITLGAVVVSIISLLN